MDEPLEVVAEAAQLLGVEVGQELCEESLAGLAQVADGARAGVGERHRRGAAVAVAGGAFDEPPFSRVVRCRLVVVRLMARISAISETLAGPSGRCRLCAAVPGSACGAVRRRHW